MKEQAIEQLAEKLGVAAEHLWGVLIKQAPVYAAMNIAEAILGGIAIWWLYTRGVALFKTAQSKDSVDSMEYRVAGAILLCVAGALFLPLIANLQWAFIALTNPEYWAFKQIVK